jgi:hypothetical protein
MVGLVWSEKNDLSVEKALRDSSERASQHFEPGDLVAIAVLRSDLAMLAELHALFLSSPRLP